MMKDDKGSFEIIQKQLQQQNPFKNLGIDIFKSLRVLDTLEGEENNKEIRRNILKAKSKIVPEEELKFIDNIVKINEVRNLLTKFKKLENEYMMEIDDQLDMNLKPELKRKMVALIEKELN